MVQKSKGDQEKMGNYPPGLDVAVDYKFMDALFERRSRRFGLGMEIEKAQVLLVLIEDAQEQFLGFELCPLQENALGDLVAHGAEKRGQHSI